MERFLGPSKVIKVEDGAELQIAFLEDGTLYIELDARWVHGGFESTVLSQAQWQHLLLFMSQNAPILVSEGEAV